MALLQTRTDGDPPFSSAQSRRSQIRKHSDPCSRIRKMIAASRLRRSRDLAQDADSGHAGRKSRRQGMSDTPVFVVQPDEGESFWQPVPANGYAEVRVSHRKDPRVTELRYRDPGDRARLLHPRARPPGARGAFVFLRGPRRGGDRRPVAPAPGRHHGLRRRRAPPQVRQRQPRSAAQDVLGDDAGRRLRPRRLLRPHRPPAPPRRAARPSRSRGPPTSTRSRPRRSSPSSPDGVAEVGRPC